MSFSHSFPKPSFLRGTASLTGIPLSTSKTPLRFIHRRGLATRSSRRFLRNRPHAQSLLCDLIRYGLVFYVGFKLGGCGKDKKEKVMAKESTKA